MRRSTAAAVGTLTGAALILGVRLSVTAPTPTAAPPPVDLAGATPKPTTSGSKKPPANGGKATRKPGNDEGGAAAADRGGLKDGTYRGDPADYAYGTIQVSIKVTDGKVSAADATYPRTGNSATINPPAIAQLKQQTLEVTAADNLDAVSGATLTTASYKKSLQAALDAAGA
jgi:uncharacterized protein with FMN-binding domain